MVGATQWRNVGGVDPSREDRTGRLKRLNFTRIEDRNFVNVRSISNHSDLSGHQRTMPTVSWREQNITHTEMFGLVVSGHQRVSVFRHMWENRRTSEPDHKQLQFVTSHCFAVALFSVFQTHTHTYTMMTRATVIWCWQLEVRWRMGQCTVA